MEDPPVKLNKFRLYPSHPSPNSKQLSQIHPVRSLSRYRRNASSFPRQISRERERELFPFPSRVTSNPPPPLVPLNHGPPSSCHRRPDGYFLPPRESINRAGDEISTRMITISPGPRSTCYRGEDEKNRIILSVTRLIRAQAGKGGVKVSLLLSTAEEKKEREREREREEEEICYRMLRFRGKWIN